MDMVERVARALYADAGLKHAASNVTLEQSWAMSPRYHDEFLRKAVAAIEAMREPTDEMVEAGTASLHGYGVEYRTVDAYTAMIDAALKKDPGRLSAGASLETDREEDNQPQINPGCSDYTGFMP